MRLVKKNLHVNRAIKWVKCFSMFLGCFFFNSKGRTVKVPEMRKVHPKKFFFLKKKNTNEKTKSSLNG